MEGKSKLVTLSGGWTGSRELEAERQLGRLWEAGSRVVAVSVEKSGQLLGVKGGRGLNRVGDFTSEWLVEHGKGAASYILMSGPDTRWCLPPVCSLCLTHTNVTSRIR